MRKSFFNTAAETQPTAIENVVNLINGLDFDAIAADIQSHRDEIEKAQAGISRARNRQAEINNEIEGLRDLDAGGVADALLADTLPKKRADADTLREEQNALSRGIGELRRRIEASEAAIERARSSSKVPVGNALDALAPLIEAEALQLVNRLCELWASCNALCRVGNSNATAQLMHKITPMIAESGRFTKEGGPIPVATEFKPIANALEPFVHKGALTMPTTSPRPLRHYSYH